MKRFKIQSKLSIRRKAIKLLFETDGVINKGKDGDFEVQPGVFAPIYVNLKATLSSCVTRLKLSKIIVTRVQGKYDFVCGIESGGAYFASSVADKMEVKLLLFRKNKKKYNIKNRFVGLSPKMGDRVLIVDDVISSGNTIASAVKELIKRGCTVKVVTIFSYCWEKTISKELGIEIESLTDAHDLISYGLSNNFISIRDAEAINEYIKREENRVYRREKIKRRKTEILKGDCLYA